MQGQIDYIIISSGMQNHNKSNLHIFLLTVVYQCNCNCRKLECTVVIAILGVVAARVQTLHFNVYIFKLNMHDFIKYTQN